MSATPAEHAAGQITSSPSPVEKLRVVHVFITAHARAAWAKASCGWSPDQSNIAVLPSPKNAVSGVQPWTILQ
jgi:hypothetical protein